MVNFLMLLVTQVCFAGDNFDVPSVWTSFAVDAGGATKRMQRPDLVGLRSLEVKQTDDLDTISVKGPSGVELTLEVNGEPLYEGGRVFVIKINTGNGQRELGEVYSQPKSRVCGCISVVDAEANAVFEEFATWNPCIPLSDRRYNADEESFTVRKFFAHACDGGEYFVSANFAYNDLTAVVIRYGQRGKFWIEEGAVIDTLFAGKYFGVPSVWELSEVNGGGVRRVIPPCTVAALRDFYVIESDGLDVIHLKNTEGVELVCDVNTRAVFEGGWVFSIKVNTGSDQQALGDVAWQKKSKSRGCISVSDVKNGAVFAELSTYPFAGSQNRRYDVREESFTVRKFFAKAYDNSEYFVSATFDYDNLTDAVIRYGRREKVFLEVGREIRTLRL